MKSVVILLLASIANGAKILLIPTDHIPEIRTFAQLGQHLKREGHHPVVLSPARHQSVIAKMDIDIDAVYVRETLSYFVNEDQEKNEILIRSSGWELAVKLKEIVYEWTDMIRSHCNTTLKSAEVQKRLRDEQFDIAIVNAIELSQCLFLIPHKLGIPYISLTWEISAWIVQVPEMPSISGQIGMNQFSKVPSFWDRFNSLVFHLIVYNSFPHATHREEHITELVPEKPPTTYQELVRKSEVILITRDNFCMDYPRLESPHVHYVGGATPSHIGPVSPEFDEFANSATNGLIVVSFGSASNPWPELMSTMMDAFRRLPQKVIMRYVGNYPNKPDNVMLSQWIPQNDLLRRNNTVLYFGHGGQCGQAEGHYHSVPMVIMPFVWDQQYVAERVDSKGYGKYVHKTSTADELYSAIVEVINNPIYKTNVHKCSLIMKSLPTSHQSIMWWVNHVLEFGGDHLKPQFGDMSVFKFFMLDVLMFIFFTVVIFMILVVKCLVFCKRKVFTKKVKEE